MTERELRKLRRSDLLEMLLDQSRELEQLRSQLKQAQERLAKRNIAIQNAGSLAEASLQLSGVFEAAEEACEQYLYNIRHLSANQEKICAQKEQETIEKCERLERETREKCEQMVLEAKQKADAHWKEVSGRIREMNESYIWLRDILEQKPNK